MISEIKIPAENEDYWNINVRDQTELFDLLKLIIAVIPVSTIFSCEDKHHDSLLIIVKDRCRYQKSEETSQLLHFATANQLSMQAICYEYGTMNDFLRRGHLFLSAKCIPENCLYQKNGKIPFEKTTAEVMEKLNRQAENTLYLGLEKAFDFFDGAVLYEKKHKLGLATFMLHQACEQLYKTIILIYTGKAVRSHLLNSLRTDASFYCPKLRYIFASKERKEQTWLALLQNAYLGARYHDDYEMAFIDFSFMKTRIYLILLAMRSDGPIEFRLFSGTPNKE